MSNWEPYPPVSKEEASWSKFLAYSTGQFFNMVGFIGGIILAAETGSWYLFLLLIPGIPAVLWGATDGKGCVYRHADDSHVM